MSRWISTFAGPTGASGQRLHRGSEGVGDLWCSRRFSPGRIQPRAEVRDVFRDPTHLDPVESYVSLATAGWVSGRIWWLPGP